MPLPSQIAFILIGSFSILLALKDWNWFWNSRRVAALTKLITKKGVQFLYIFIGIMLITFAFLGFFGIVD